MKNDITEVIDRTDLIENIMNQIIEKFISPREEIFSFFWDVFLDSSITSFGTKVKLVILISHEITFPIDENSIRRLNNLRNAFAHHRQNSHPTIIIGETPEEDKSIYMLQTITSNLKLKRIPRESALKDFNEKFASAKKTLVELRNAVVKHHNGEEEKT